MSASVHAARGSANASAIVSAYASVYACAAMAIGNWQLAIGSQARLQDTCKSECESEGMSICMCGNGNQHQGQVGVCNGGCHTHAARGVLQV